MAVVSFPARLRALKRDLDAARHAFLASQPPDAATEAEERAWELELEALSKRLTAAWLRYEDERHMQFLLRQEQSA